MVYFHSTSPQKNKIESTNIIDKIQNTDDEEKEKNKLFQTLFTCWIIRQFKTNETHFLTKRND